MENQNSKEKKLYRALALAIVALFAVGLVLLLCKVYSIGLALWFISTVAGAIMLYIKKKREKRALDEQQQEEEEQRYQAARKAEKN